MPKLKSQTLKKTAQIWKSYPKFCQWLFKDLYKAWQDGQNDLGLLSPD